MIKTNHLAWIIYRELSNLSCSCRHKLRKSLIRDWYCWTAEVPFNKRSLSYVLDWDKTRQAFENTRDTVCRKKKLQATIVDSTTKKNNSLFKLKLTTFPHILLIRIIRFLYLPLECLYLWFMWCRPLERLQETKYAKAQARDCKIIAKLLLALHTDMWPI